MSSAHALDRGRDRDRAGRGGRPDTGATGSPSTTTCAAWRAARRRSSPRRSRAAYLAHPGRRGGDHAAQPRPVQGRGGLPHPARAAPGPHRPRARPGAGHRPADRARAAPRISTSTGVRTSREQVAELLAFLGDGFPAGHPYGGWSRPRSSSEQPQLFVLGSSAYGPQFAAVNGMSAVFAHHMSPDPAVRALREYRRTSRPRQDGASRTPAISVLSFASDDPDAVTRVRGRLDVDHAEPAPRSPRAAAPRAGQGVRAVAGVPARQPGRADGHRRGQGRGRAAGRAQGGGRRRTRSCSSRRTSTGPAGRQASARSPKPGARPDSTHPLPPDREPRSARG